MAAVKRRGIRAVGVGSAGLSGIAHPEVAEPNGHRMSGARHATPQHPSLFVIAGVAASASIRGLDCERHTFDKNVDYYQQELREA